jgi:drug/metabolite transporter (DMT)-like permease
MAAGLVKGYASVAVAALLWASCGTMGKYLFAGGMTPFELVQLRLGIASVGLAIYLAVFDRSMLRIRLVDLPHFVLLGGAAMALTQFTYFFAISKIQVAAAILLQYMAPIIVAAYSVCFWGERFTLRKVTALILAIGGCYLVVGGYNVKLLEMNRLGILSGLASAVCFAAYALLGEMQMHRYRPLTVVFYAFVFASLSVHLISPPFHFLNLEYTVAQTGAIMYVGVFGTIFPFVLYYVGINYIRSTRAVITATLEPIAAGIMAFAFLGESPALLQIVGGLLVISGIVTLQLDTGKDELAPEVVRRHGIP